MVAAQNVHLEVGEGLDLAVARDAEENALLCGARVLLAEVGRDSLQLKSQNINDLFYKWLSLT